MAKRLVPRWQFSSNYYELLASETYRTYQYRGRNEFDVLLLKARDEDEFALRFQHRIFNLSKRDIERGLKEPRWKIIKRCTITRKDDIKKIHSTINKFFENLKVEKVKDIVFENLESRTILSQNLTKVLESYDPKDEKDFESLNFLLAKTSDVSSKISDKLNSQILEIFSKLSKEDEETLREFNTLLDDWSLHQINIMISILSGKLKTIRLLRDIIQDEKTYEMQGDNSVHKTLENNLWIIDDGYELLQSNKTMANFVGGRVKEDKKLAKRPDIICSSYGKVLVFVELKRPSHPSKKEDIEQLLNYMEISEEYSGTSKISFKTIKGYLICNAFSSDVKKRSKRINDIELLTYTDLLSNAEERYREYLKAYESKKDTYETNYG